MKAEADGYRAFLERVELAEDGGAALLAAPPGFLRGPADARSPAPAPPEPDQEPADEAARAWRDLCPGLSLVREIGRGGMGVVFEALELGSGRRVAVKVLHREAWGAEAQRRLLVEASALGRVEHPGVVSLYRVDRTRQGVPFIVMRLVEGEPVLPAATALPVRDRVRVTAALCEAVQAAHDAGVLHLDIKPSNVLLHNNAGFPISVLDFGIAKLTEGGDGLTLLTHAFATPECVSPEQADLRAVGPASDVYAIGVLLYRMLSGRPPVNLAGLPPSHVARRLRQTLPPSLRGEPGVDARLAAVAARAVAPDTRDRYASPGALAEDLGRWLRGENLSGAPSSPWRSLRGLAVRRPRSFAAVTAAAVLALGGAAAAGGLAHEFRAQRDDMRLQAVQRIGALYWDLASQPGSIEARAGLLAESERVIADFELDPARSPGSAVAAIRLQTHIACLWGHPSFAGLEDTRRSREAFAVATRTASEAVRRFPKNPGVRVAASDAFFHAGTQREPDARLVRRGLEILRRGSANPAPGTDDLARDVMLRHALIELTTDPSSAARAAGLAALVEELSPHEARLAAYDRTRLALLHSGLGVALESTGDPGAAGHAYEHSLRVLATTGEHPLTPDAALWSLNARVGLARTAVALGGDAADAAAGLEAFAAALKEHNPLDPSAASTAAKLRDAADRLRSPAPGDPG